MQQTKRKKKRKRENLPLLVVNAGQVAVNDCIVGAEIKSTQISGDGPAVTIKKEKEKMSWRLREYSLFLYVDKDVITALSGGPLNPGMIFKIFRAIFRGG